ncbi:MAG: hypothetical protein K2L86_08385 [Lachnospiraceae bacterium]|nr:hypothetical protein [Lachnospiraceae bacterium]
MRQRSSEGGKAKKFKMHIVRALVLLVAGISVGYGLLLLVYLLPTEPMRAHLAESAAALSGEREYHRVIPGVVSTQLDNYTDSWMVGNAVYDSPRPVWKRALTCTSADFGKGPLDGLVRYLGTEQGYREVDYTRYWHGYLVLLKPFFLFFDYGDLRVFNVIVELLLVLLIFRTISKMGYEGEAWGYVLSVLFMMPVVIPLSIQFSVIFYLTNLAVFILLKAYDWIVDGIGLLLYFQLIGMCASYFDLLTYPIASLGVPLVCILLLEAERDSWTKVRTIVGLSVSWGFGYGAMWAGKWVLSTLVLRDSVIANALSQIVLRTAHTQNGEQITVLGTWLRNVEFYFEKPYLILIALCMAAVFAGIFRSRGQLADVCIDIIPFLLIAVMPFVWYALAGQHSYEHHWFTFRGLVTTVFACMCICARLYRDADTGYSRRGFRNGGFS